MFSNKIEKTLVKKVASYLNKITPDSVYWKGEHTWQEMVNFRKEISNRRNKNGFSKSDQISILTWGGIYKFSSYSFLPSGLEELNNGKLTYQYYSRISSMSKLFSFHSPDRYFILDARVALSINHIITNENTGDRLIPFNPAKSKGGQVRNSLAKLRNKNNEYENLGVAYIAYNDLILRIFQSITIPNKLPKRPELVEMVLFSMATEYYK
jgi:hypothetical protein